MDSSGLRTDILSPINLDSLMLEVSDFSGQDYFQVLVAKLSTSVGADHAFLAKLDSEELNATTLAYWADGKSQDNFSYALRGTPCSDLSKSDVCCISDSVADRYPEDQMLVDMGIESYLGVTLKSRAGKIIGILVALFKQPVISVNARIKLFHAFSLRASAELEQHLLDVHLIEKIDELKEKNKKLNIAQKIYDFTTDGIIVTDSENNIIYINSSLERMSGYKQSELLGKNPRALNSGLQTKKFYEGLWGAIFKKGHWQGELYNRHKNGQPYPVLTSITAIPADESGAVNYLAIHHDLSEEKEASDLISYQATHDQLTGLLNRYEFNEQLKRHLSHVKRYEEGAAFLMLGVDHFKSVNESMGPLVGDDLLKQIALRIGDRLREEDLFARFGDDEFTVFSVFNDHQGVESLVHSLLSLFDTPFQLGNGGSLSVSASIGVSVYGRDADNADDLRSCAGRALQQAKLSGRRTYAFFSKELRLQAERAVEVHQRLVKALDEGDVKPYFQPIVDIKTNQICHVEALARWSDDHLGVVNPDEFIAIAERYGLIQKLDDQVSTESLKQIKQLNSDLEVPIGVSLNKSPQELITMNDGDSGIVDLAEEIKFPAHLIAVELTENVMVKNPERAQEYLNKLKAKGFKLSMDDFGTGYSSLAYLKYFPFDTLKIDRTFVAGIANNESDFNLVKTIIGMAANFGMKTIAEGVETLEQLEILRDLGCHYAQGYLYSPALPVEKLSSLIKSHNIT